MPGNAKPTPAYFVVEEVPEGAEPLSSAPHPVMGAEAAQDAALLAQHAADETGRRFYTCAVLEAFEPRKPEDQL